jgi:enolase
LVNAIQESGYEGKVKIALDVAASEFWNEEEHVYDLSYKWGKG